MKQFLENIKNSISNPQWYSSFLASNDSGFGYFFKLIAVLSLLFTITLGFRILPGMGVALGEVATQVTKAFPADLKVQVKDGQVSTNVQEPYFIPMPNRSASDMRAPKNEPMYLAVIDTQAEPTAAELEKHDTAVLVTKSAIVYYDSSKYQTRIQDLGAFGGIEFELSQQTVGEFAEKMIPILKRLAPGLLLFVYFGVFMANAALLLYALFGALLVMLVARVRKNQATYGKLYATTLHLMTLPLLVIWLFRAISMWYPLPPVPFAFSILLVIAAVINLKPQAAAPQPVAESAATKQPVKAE